MRLTSRVTLVVVMGSALGVGACAAPQPLDSQLVQAVSIITSCVDDTLAFKLSPWTRHVEEGGRIDWTMTVTDGSVAEFFVEPVHPGKWPYVETGKMRGTPNLPAQAKGMKNGAPSKNPYRYKVQFDCQPAGGGAPLRVIIDPDVVVDDAGQ